MNARNVFIVMSLVFSASAFGTCPRDPESVAIKNFSFELGDQYDGQVGTAKICGGCYFVGAPGGPAPDGVVSPDANFPLVVSVDWGDGTLDRTTVPGSASDTGGARMDPGGLIMDKHTFKSQVIDPARAYTVSVSAWCVNKGQPTWESKVDNHCTGLQGCTPSNGVVGVFPILPPTDIDIVHDVKHGEMAQNALSVTIGSPAKAGGTKIWLKSSAPQIVPVGTKDGAYTIVVIKENTSSATFDLDAKKARAGLRFTIEASNRDHSKPIVMNSAYRVK